MSKVKKKERFPVALSGVLFIYFVVMLFASLITSFGDFLVRYIDEPVMQWILSIRTTELTNFFLFITDFGSTFVILTLAIVLTLFLIAASHVQRASLLWFLIIGASSMMFIAKAFVQRARPAEDLALIHETLFAFPSGHATMAIVFYGFVAWSLYHSRTALRALFVLSLAIFITLIAFSRIYLGVHFATDVIAGLVLGGLWLTLGVSLQHWWSHVDRLK